MSRMNPFPNNFSIFQSGPTLAIILIGLLGTAYFAYLVGYWDGYHPAVIYVGGQP